MSTIVFFCIPAYGHTNPTLGVVRELVARGHNVVYYSYDAMREPIEATGAAFVSCNRYDAEQRLSPQDGKRLGSDLAFSTRMLVDTTLALDNAILSDMRALAPDCIVADSMAIWGKLIAQKLGIPFVSSTTTFAFNRYSAGMMKQSPVRFLRMLCSMPKIGREIKRLQAAGYPVKNVLDIIQNDDSTDTIVYTSPEFQPYSDTFSADHYAFVGPSVRPAETRMEKPCQPLVYISLGTVVNDQPSFYRQCITALADSPCRVILSVGEQVSPADLGALPQNAEAHPQVDQIAVLQVADVFLTHCGMNSVNEALYFGVPLVMFPQTPEQGGVCTRVLQLGAGVKLEKPDAASIRKAIDAVRLAPAYREKAAEISAGFRRCAGAKGAAEKILQVIGRASRSSFFCQTQNTNSLCRMNNFVFCSMRHKLFFCFWRFFPIFVLSNFSRYSSFCLRLPNFFFPHLQQPLFCAIISADRRKAPQSRREPLLLIYVSVPV